MNVKATASAVVRALRENPVRLYLYGVLVPVMSILVYYGAISQDEMPLWLGLGAALLAVPAVEVARHKVEPLSKQSVSPPEE